MPTRVPISHKRPHRRRARTNNRSHRSHRSRPTANRRSHRSRPTANRRSRGTRSRDDILRSRDANRDGRHSHGSRDSRDRPALRSSRKPLLSLLCRRHRTSPSSRPRFLPHRGRLDCHLRCLKESLLPVLQGRQTRCSPATMTIQRPPIRAGLCSDAFVLKFASLGASSPPFSPRQMLNRWAAFESDSRHLYTGVLSRCEAICSNCVTTSQVRLGGAKREYAGEGTREGAGCRAGGTCLFLRVLALNLAAGL